MPLAIVHNLEPFPFFTRFMYADIDLEQHVALLNSLLIDTPLLSFRAFSEQFRPFLRPISLKNSNPKVEIYAIRDALHFESHNRVVTVGST